MARQNFKTSGIRVDSIELGNDTDTTISRDSAGSIAVEGSAVKRPATTTTVSANTATEIYSFNPTTHTTAELTVQVRQGTKVTSQKAIVNHNSSTAFITNYAVLEHGTTRIPLTLEATYVSVSSVSVTATITDAATTNATVKVLPALMEI